MSGLESHQSPLGPGGQDRVDLRGVIITEVQWHRLQAATAASSSARISSRSQAGFRISTMAPKPFSQRLNSTVFAKRNVVRRLGGGFMPG
jgi:hypothetical protein